MRAWMSFRWRRKTWRVAPWVSLRAAGISLLIVVATALVFDHWILARLEKRGLIASDDWKRHNQIVIANHEKKDRQIAYERPKPDGPCGVRSWLGHPVEKQGRTQHRLLVMGDSFVWGSPYLTLNHLWWRQLAIELKRRGYHDVEVIAAGCSGMSTRDELELARRVVPDFHPDLILWGFVTNDPDERLVKQIHTSQLAPPIPGRIQKVLERFIPRLWELFKSRRADKLAKSYVGPEYGYSYDDWLNRIHEGENFERYQQTVADVGRFMNESQTPALFVTLPEAPIRSRFAFSYDKVVALWEAAGVPVLNSLDTFVQQFPDAESTGPNSLVWGINPADGHPGPRTTAFLARQTADRLERDFPQVLGPRTLEPPRLTINDWLPYDLDVSPLVEAGLWELDYPRTEKFLPTMPLGIPTTLMALELPQSLDAIRLSSSGLRSAQIWISTCDPDEGYDTGEWHDLGTAKGTELNWVIPDGLARRDVAVILLKADVSSDDRRLRLMLVPAQPSSSRSEGEK